MDELKFGSQVEFVGPFEHHEVVVSGWQVPLLEAQEQSGGRIMLSLDQRFGVELTLQEAERIVPFIAQCIAVGLGFNAHPSGEAEPKPLPRVRPRRMVGLELQSDPTT